MDTHGLSLLFVSVTLGDCHELPAVTSWQASSCFFFYLRSKKKSAGNLASLYELATLAKARLLDWSGAWWLEADGQQIELISDTTLRYESKEIFDYLLGYRAQLFWVTSCADFPCSKLRPDIERGLLDFWSVIGRLTAELKLLSRTMSDLSMLSQVQWLSCPDSTTSRVYRPWCVQFRNVEQRPLAASECSPLKFSGDFSFQHLRHGRWWQSEFVRSCDCCARPSS